MMHRVWGKRLSTQGTVLGFTRSVSGAGAVVAETPQNSSLTTGVGERRIGSGVG